MSADQDTWDELTLAIADLSDALEAADLKCLTTIAIPIGQRSADRTPDSVCIHVMWRKHNGEWGFYVGELDNAVEPRPINSAPSHHRIAFAKSAPQIIESIRKAAEGRNRELLDAIKVLRNSTDALEITYEQR
jgi:hypothetical protein